MSTRRAGRRRADRRRTWRVVWLTVIVMLLGAWVMTLRPQGLGGPAGYVMVRGVSMLPSFEPGDLVVVRPHDRYEIGDVVAFRIPEGEVGAGATVIHRIVGGSAAAGFVLQGDNNDDPDDWRPTADDVVGAAWLRVPKLGRALAFLHAPLPLASLATGIAAAIVLVPGTRRHRRAPSTRGRCDRREGSGRRRASRDGRAASQRQRRAVEVTGERHAEE
jgi:signal peptidase